MLDLTPPHPVDGQGCRSLEVGCVPCCEAEAGTNWIRGVHKADAPSVSFAVSHKWVLRPSLPGHLDANRKWVWPVALWDALEGAGDGKALPSEDSLP